MAYRRIAVLSLLCAAFLLLSVSLSGRGDSAAPNRRDALLKALQGKAPSARLRAIDELGEMIRDDPSLARVMLGELFGPETSLVDGYEIMKALGKSDVMSADDVVEVFQRTSSQSDFRYELLLTVLGRMGAKANSAAAFLQAQLERQDLGLTLQGKTRVVLANIAHADPANTAAIEAALAAIGHADPADTAAIEAALSPRDEVGIGVVRMMAEMRTSDWATDKMVSSLIEWLPMDNPAVFKFSPLAASALGLIGERAKPAADEIKRQIKATEKEEELGTYRVFYGLALARVAPSQRRLALHEVMKSVGPAEGAGHTTFLALPDIAALMEPSIVDEVVRALGDSDPDVVRGALRMLYAVGLRAKDTAPKVIDILKSNRNESVRAEAAATLGYVADVSLLPVVEQMLKKDKETPYLDPVRDALVGSVARIRLDESP